MTVPAWPWRALIGGLFLLAGVAWLIRDEQSRRKVCAGGFPPALLLFLLIWSGLPGRILPEMPFPGYGGDRWTFVTAAFILLAWALESLRRQQVLHPRHLALAGASLLFLLSPDFIGLVSAWVLLDLFLVLGGERVYPGAIAYLTASGTGTLALLGAFSTGPSLISGVLWAVAISIRAGIFPWPRVRCKSAGCALLSPLLALHLLRLNGMQSLGWWRWPFYLWLGVGLAYQALDFLRYEFSLELPLPSPRKFYPWKKIPLTRPRLPSPEVLENKITSLVAGFGDFWEGESGWLWVMLVVVIWAFGLKGAKPLTGAMGITGHLPILWDRLFPTGLGIMTSSFLLLVAESESVILFALLAQYVMAAFNLTGEAFDLLPALLRIILGGWVCLLLYLHRWGIRWLGGNSKGGTVRFDFVVWLLRIAMGVAAGLLAYTATSRWRIHRLPLETQLAIFWLEAMGLFNALLPGAALRKATGVLTMLIGIDTLYTFLAPGLKELALMGIAQITVALVAAFLAAYEGAGVGRGGGAR